MSLRRPVLRLVAFALAAVVAGGCTVPEPPGPQPLRYRDQVFTSVEVTRDLVYGSAPDLEGNPVTLRLDLYQPRGDTVARRPAVVWIHGGGFAVGSKGDALMSALATAFAQQGYVAVSIDYRLLAARGCGGSGDPPAECFTAALAAQHDAQAAVRWLRTHAAEYRIDPARVGMGGSSAGAVTSLLVGWRSEDPGTSGNPGPSSAIGGAVSISGGAPTDAFINRGDAPAVLFHGTLDTTVPYRWAVSNAAAMLQAGVVAFLQPIEGAGHNLAAGHRELIFRQSTFFLYHVLELAHAEGTPRAAARAYERRAARWRERYPEFADR